VEAVAADGDMARTIRESEALAAAGTEAQEALLKDICRLLQAQQIPEREAVAVKALI